jgi:hypothetical protein
MIPTPSERAAIAARHRPCPGGKGDPVWCSHPGHCLDCDPGNETGEPCDAARLLAWGEALEAVLTKIVDAAYLLPFETAEHALWATVLDPELMQFRTPRAALTSQATEEQE